MADSGPLPTRLRIAAAAMIAAAASASCATGEVTIDDRSAETTPMASSVIADDHLTDIISTQSLPTTTTTTITSDDAVGIEPLWPGGTVNGVAENFQAADPVTIRIPSIQVEAPIIGLGLRDDGSIEVPEDTDQTGWWRDGPEPGEKGPSVILGHVDSRVGPAVFFRLTELKAGDRIHIDREDGTTVTYAVESSEHHAKDDFPTDAVYGATDEPTLRLVTCGGDFDRNARSYIDNLIVFASLA